MTEKLGFLMHPEEAESSILKIFKESRRVKELFDDRVSLRLRLRLF